MSREEDLATLAKIKARCTSEQIRIMEQTKYGIGPAHMTPGKPGYKNITTSVTYGIWRAEKKAEEVGTPEVESKPEEKKKKEDPVRVSPEQIQAEAEIRYAQSKALQEKFRKEREAKK